MTTLTAPRTITTDDEAACPDCWGTGNHHDRPEDTEDDMDPMHDESWTVEYCPNARYVVQSTRGHWRKEWRIWDTSDQTEIRADPRMLMGMPALDYLLHTAHYLNGRHEGQRGI